ncbi:hypothetical protein STSP2_02436 [Anaerohalosphaera lusitana]|uniref:DUF3179 domain-containing protein n=1 Tax=Anaerohalosphaera lusitana TaxID=1936003 RepID=A0A1U9NN70_9BACT|nr:DUF3179 domain-containing protein [Anaerohalosphaera lusitana]AQT69247.1 hypothetical protein STSP2_02436 [Anaerohalosphaera lusitana]
MAAHVKKYILVLVVVSAFLCVLITARSYQSKYSWAYGEVNLAGWRTNVDKSVIALGELVQVGIGKESETALRDPWFETAGSASFWVEDTEPVLVTSIGDTAKAYPLQILVWHQIVNDEINGVNIAVTYCPLCSTAVVYGRDLNDSVYDFYVSGFVRYGNFVMYDDSTETLWQQYTGQGLVGDLAGEYLVRVPSQIITFERFRSAYPDGEVLSQVTGVTRDYGLNPYWSGYDYYYGSYVGPGLFYGQYGYAGRILNVSTERTSKAYSYLLTRNEYVLNDIVAGQPVVIFNNGSTDYGLMDATGVFDRSFDGRVLEFKYEDGDFVDHQTGSRWNIMGHCVEGQYKGRRLDPLNYTDTLEETLETFEPGVEIYQPDGEIEEEW